MTFPAAFDVGTAGRQRLGAGHGPDSAPAARRRTRHTDVRRPPFCMPVSTLILSIRQATHLALAIVCLVVAVVARAVVVVMGAHVGSDTIEHDANQIGAYPLELFHHA